MALLLNPLIKPILMQPVDKKIFNYSSVFSKEKQVKPFSDLLYPEFYLQTESIDMAPISQSC